MLSADVTEGVLPETANDGGGEHKREGEGRGKADSNLSTECA